MVRIATRTLGFGALLLTAGCVQYVATGPERLSPGDEVRLRLAPDPESRFRAASGRPLESIQGRTVGFTLVGDSLQVMIPRDPMVAGAGPLVGGLAQPGERFLVTLHPSEVLLAERKTISRTRSALAAFGISAVAVSLFRSVARDRKSGRGGEEEPVAPPVDF